MRVICILGCSLEEFRSRFGGSARIIKAISQSGTTVEIRPGPGMETAFVDRIGALIAQNVILDASYITNELTGGYPGELYFFDIIKCMQVLTLKSLNVTLEVR